MPRPVVLKAFPADAASAETKKSFPFTFSLHFFAGSADVCGAHY